MDRRIVLLCILFIGVLPWASTEPAWADEHYKFDETHTVIEFGVSNFGLFELTGTFDEYDGNFVFCTEHPDKDSISMTLYSKGIHAEDKNMDEKLQGPHFFNAVRFPSISFASTKVVLTDKDNAEVAGNLTLLGITKPMTLHVHFLQKDPDADHDDDDDYVVNFSASGIIHRSDFGMDYLSPFIVGDEVHLRIEARGVEDDEPAPDKKAPHTP